MIAGTSTVSIVTWQRTQSSSLPSRSSDISPPSPTVLYNARILQPRTTPSPICPPNELVIHLTTTLVIPDYTRYYAPTPIESFQPAYQALPDASLVTAPYLEDLTGANITLLMTGVLTMLFARNIIVSGDYIRRGKVKRKALFYILFLSQILAPVSLFPIIMSYFNQAVHCTVVVILSCLSGTVSLALLITGILGVKAYKCLNNSRVVLVALVLLQCASSAVVAMDLASIRASRRLSGSCIRISDLRFTRVFVMIQFVESLFICLCFVYACWKWRGSPGVRGRISLQLSMENVNSSTKSGQLSNQRRRGWGDSVSSEKPPDTFRDDSHPQQSEVHGTWNRTSAHTHQAPSLQHSVLSSPSLRPPPSSIRISDPSPGRIPYQAHPIPGRSSPSPSSLSRLSKLLPRADLFREVMKDELLYTTFITATCVVVAVLAVIGVNFKNGLTVTGWIALNWGVISLLAIHSFGRVVRRHEREALLQHPSIWDRTGHLKEVRRRNKARRPLSLPSRMRFRRHSLDSDDLDNPFADTQRLEQARSSWNSAGFTSSSNGSPPTSPVVTLRSFLTQPSQNMAFVLSPFDSGFPSSGRGTPLVPHEGSDGTLIQDFSADGWVFERRSSGNTSEYLRGDGESEANVS